MEEMPDLSEHLSSLRQEINALRTLNALTKKGRQSEPEQAALDLRAKRLREIKDELSRMLSDPDAPKVWWERFPKAAIA